MVLGCGGDGTSSVNNNRQFLASITLLSSVSERNILPHFIDLDDSGIIYKGNSERVKQTEHKQLTDFKEMMRNRPKSVVSLNSTVSFPNPDPNTQSTLKSDLVSTRLRMSQIYRKKAKHGVRAAIKSKITSNNFGNFYEELVQGGINKNKQTNKNGSVKSNGNLSN